MQKVWKKASRHVEKIKLLKTKHYVFFSILTLVIFLMIFDFIKGGVTHTILSSDVHKLNNLLDGFGKVTTPIIFVLLITIEVLLAPIPGFIFYITGAAIFGWFWGGILTLTGNMIGATLCFFLARYLGREYVEKKVQKTSIEKFDKYTSRYGGYAIFFLRINPLTSSDLFSYASGFSKMPFKSFFFGTLLGLLPLVFLQNYFGATLIGISPAFYWVFVGLSMAYLIGTIYLIYVSASK